jgi:hypothetical protein
VADVHVAAEIARGHDRKRPGLARRHPHRPQKRREGYPDAGPQFGVRPGGKQASRSALWQAATVHPVSLRRISPSETRVLQAKLRSRTLPVQVYSARNADYPMTLLSVVDRMKVEITE